MIEELTARTESAPLRSISKCPSGSSYKRFLRAIPERSTSAPSRRSVWLTLVLIPLLLFALALATRTYHISSIPYFKPGPPLYGAANLLHYRTLAGIYNDEFTNVVVISHFRVDPFSSLGGGFIAPVLIWSSFHLLGTTLLAVRIPFAIISSITSVVIYFTTRKLSQSAVAALLSSLYFIVMMPALIYGRMAFGENLIALLFILLFYCTLRINEESSSGTGSVKKWLLAAAILAGLCVIVKLSGIVVILFLIVYLAKKRTLRKWFLYPVLSLVIGLLLPFGIFELLAKESALNVIHTGALGLSYIGAFTVGSELSIMRFFLLDTLPSGAIIHWGDIPVPEFWYIFLYLTLGVLVLREYSRYSDLFLALALFVAFVGVLMPIGSYFLIIIQPLLAISFGPGVKKLLQIPLAGSLAVYIFLFVPLATSLGIALIVPSLLGTPYIYNVSLSVWKLLVVLPPLIILLAFTRWHTTGSRWRTLINCELLIAYFAVLLVATFLVPDLYPYYI